MKFQIPISEKSKKKVSQARREIEIFLEILRFTFSFSLPSSFVFSSLRCERVKGSERMFGLVVLHIVVEKVISVKENIVEHHFTVRSVFVSSACGDRFHE